MAGDERRRHRRSRGAPRQALTEQQRREEKQKAKKLTSEFRSHLEELEQDREDNRDPRSNRLSEHFVKASENQKKGFTVEHALLDATIFQQLSFYSKQQAAKLQTGLKEYDLKSFVDKLQLSMEANDDDDSPEEAMLDLNLLGRQVWKFFKTAHSIDFMLGQADAEVRKRKRGRKAGESFNRKMAAAKPQVLTEESGGKTETDKEIERMYAALKAYGPTVNFYEFLVDPNSFTRTVENIFHASFLIKDGRAMLDMQKDIATLTLKEQKFDADGAVAMNDEDCEQSQMILRFDYNTWKKVVEEYNIQNCVLPSKQSRIS